MSDTPAGPTPADLKAALKAFRKRLKLANLDNSSSLAGGPLTGRSSSIVGITPPNQYPDAVWKELVRQGKLRSLGGGMYALADG
jgi:hypothetical protein